MKRRNLAKILKIINHFYRLKLSLHYDNQFLKHVAKNDKETAKHKIREIVSLAGPIFQAKPWKLGHSIELVEKEISYVDEDLTLKYNNAVTKM